MIIGIDTGGTKTLISSFNDGNYIPTKSFKFPTPQNEEDYVNSLLENIKSYFDINSIEIISIAIPGILSNDSVIRRCAHLPWKDFDLLKSLKEKIGKDIPILLENDAKLGAYGEYSSLQNKPESLAYITVSTGIGGGVIYNGNIDKSLNNSEVGHMKLNFNNELVEWENFAAGSAIYKKYNKFAKDINDVSVWREIGRNIGVGLLAFIPVVQPNIISIGGSIGTYFNNYQEFLNQYIEENISSYIDLPQIKQAFDPENAVIYGCYYYARNFEENSQKNI
jgi:glucokinase